MRKKKCSKCHTVKKESDFYVAKKFTGYKQPWCKKCDCKRTKERNKKVGYYHSKVFRERVKNAGYHKYERRKEWILKYRKNNKDAIKARVAVQKAINHKILRKLPCQVCNELKVHAHHHKGYAHENWLIITWLCNEHHRQAHYGK